MANLIDNALTAVPATLVAGDTLKVDDAAAASDYPASAGFSVKWIFTPQAGGTPVTVNGTGGAAAWSLLVAATATAGWTAGAWRWAQQAVKGAALVTIARGDIVILPDPTAANTDVRSHARKVLASIEAAIEGRATATDLKVTFEDGRSIERMSHMELLKMRDAYAAKVAAEDRRAAGRGPIRILASL